MKLLYIWDGNKPLPPQREAAVRSVLAHLPDAECWCITKLDRFVSDRFKILPWKSVAQAIQDYFGVEDVDNLLGTAYLHMTDWARFWFLFQNPGTLYLDTDITFPDRYDFEAETRVVSGLGLICLLWAPQGGAFSGFEPVLRGILARHARYSLLYRALRRVHEPWHYRLPDRYFSFPELNTEAWRPHV